MIHSQSFTPPKGGIGARVSDEVPGASSRAAESLFVVCVFVLMAVNIWFTSGGQGAAGDVQSSIPDQVVWCMVYLVSAVVLFRCREKVGDLVRGSVPIVALMALASASTMWSTDPNMTFKSAIALWGTSAFSYYVVSRFRLKEFVDILGVTSFVIVILSLLAVVLLPSIGVMHVAYPGAWRGIFNHKNNLGEFAVFSLLTFGTIIFSRSWRPRVAIVGASLSLALLVGSQDVSALVVCAVLLVAAVLTAFYLRGSPGLRFMRLALGVSALLVIAVALLASGVDSQVLLNTLGRDETLTGRTTLLWPGVLQAISNRPWLGYGYNTFWLPNGDWNYFVGFNPTHAHNGFLQICLDVGILGAAVAALAILGALRRGVASLHWSLEQCSAWPLLAVIYFIVVNLTESNLARYNNFDWVVFVVAFLYASQAAKEPQKPVSSIR
jgi:exopolysaccharide production protein ExoQ